MKKCILSLEHSYLSGKIYSRLPILRKAHKVTTWLHPIPQNANAIIALFENPLLAVGLGNASITKRAKCNSKNTF